VIIENLIYFLIPTLFLYLRHHPPSPTRSTLVYQRVSVSLTLDIGPVIKAKLGVHLF